MNPDIIAVLKEIKRLVDITPEYKLSFKGYEDRLKKKGLLPGLVAVGGITTSFGSWRDDIGVKIPDTTILLGLKIPYDEFDRILSKLEEEGYIDFYQQMDDEIGGYHVQIVPSKKFNDLYAKASLKFLPQPEKTSDLVTPQKSSSRDSSLDIFIVHGHDNTLKVEVARLLEKQSLRPIILHEQANKSRSLMQKLEDHSDVRFAVVLLTPDDIGGEKGLEEQMPRARQNVVFELGFFFGKLKRENVCALYSKGVEKPSDLEGITYILIDEAGKWKYDLAKELAVAGFKIDLSKVV